MAFPRRDVAVVGVYLTEQAPSIDRSPASLQIEALQGVLEDAGLSIADVDGIGTNDAQLKPPHILPGGPPEMFWSEQLNKKVITLQESGHPAAAIAKAAALISSGFSDTFVFLHGRSGQRLNPSKAPAVTKAPRVGEWNYGIWGGFMSPFYAMWAQRYMAEFGVTSEQLAEVAVAARYHATLNPKSIMGKRGPITVEDVVNSRIIAHPLHLLDCCIDNDGGYAIAITTAEKAKSLKKKPVYILGGSESSYIDPYINQDTRWFPKEGKAVRKAADIAFSMAGVTRDDIDVAELYDCFTITTIRDIEEMGFCGVGEGADFIQGGTIRLGGKLPVNTNGGLMSCSHNGHPGGMHVIEAVRQLRGNDVEPERQVKDAKIGLALGQGMAVHGTCGVVILATD